MRIKDDVVNKIVIQRSEFICYLSKCLSEEECRIFIDMVRSEHALLHDVHF